CSAWLPEAAPGRSLAAAWVSVGLDAASEPKVKIPGLPVLSGSVPSKSSMVETAPSVGMGLLFKMLTVVVVRGPIPVPDGVALASATVNDLVGAFSGFGRATRWIVCVVWPGAKVSVPEAAV